MRRQMLSDMRELIKKGIEKILDLAGMSLWSEENDDDRIIFHRRSFTRFPHR
jgi:hypothetical protein